MKKTIVVLILLISTIALAGEDVHFAWDPNSESILVGYKIYRSNDGNAYIQVGNDKLCAPNDEACCRFTDSGVPDGTWYWVVTAYNSKNEESVYSNQLTKIIDTSVPPDQYELSTITNGNGGISTNPSGTIFDDGTMVELTAIPATGWVFDYWAGDLSGSVNPQSLLIDSDRVVTANFAISSYSFFENFNGYTVGSDPVDWIDTGANNSMSEVDLFEVFDLSGEKVFGTNSTLPNIHSHRVGVDISTYEYSGRMMTTDPGGGIGVTFNSQYPIQDIYYRLRQYNNGSFHINPHGANVQGDIDTGVVPIANAWYMFRIMVEEGSIKAKVWKSGDAEPGWQIDCFGSLTNGTFGIWSYSSGSKYWDDLAISQESELLPPQNFRMVE